MIAGIRKSRSGFTLVELTIATTIGLIAVSALGIMMVGAQRAWSQVWASAQQGIKIDALDVGVTFGSIGRQSNNNYNTDPTQSGYVLYTISGSSNTFTQAVPSGSATQIVSGDAVELRYWNPQLTTSNGSTLLNSGTIANSYALFYKIGSQLLLDRGPFPPGAVNGTSRRTGAGITTQVLARNVTSCKFNHTTVGGDGQGSVRINMRLTDPNDGSYVDVKTTTFLRNDWPR